jgi:kinesin family member C1
MTLNKENSASILEKKEFNKSKVKNAMKEMLRKSESGHSQGQLLNSSINSGKNNPFLQANSNIKIVETNPKPKFNSTLELHNNKVSELEEVVHRTSEALDKQNLYLKILQEENSDSEKLIQFFKEQIEAEKRKYEEMEAEEKKTKYREENLIEQARRELSENMSKIQSIKEECFSLESEVTDKEYKLASMKQRGEEMSRKIDYVTLELEDKIKLKQFKENEFSTKDKILEETKERVIDVNRINTEYIDYLRLVHNDLQESKGNIRVFCRVRPPLPKEEKENTQNYIEFPNFNTIILNGPVTKSNVGKTKEIQNKEIYKFDRVFRPEDNQAEVFKEISQLVQSALDGYNVCIFAYGQTGSGKTYTMEGEDLDKRGIIPRSIEQIFEFKSTLESMGWSFQVDASCVEIYNDQVRDLLMNGNNNIISQTNNKIDKFTVFEVKYVEDLHKIVETAATKRSVAETMCNEKSSRSHCIFQLKITGKNTKTKQERSGALNLIDLAGSERVSSSKVEGERLKETIAINKSLTCLKSVITALVNNNHKSNSHIPYRDSILTWILKEYLGGESKTLMFVNISPLMSNFSESSCSLKFASDVNSCYLKSAEEK